MVMSITLTEAEVEKIILDHVNSLSFVNGKASYVKFTVDS